MSTVTPPLHRSSTPTLTDQSVVRESPRVSPHRQIRRQTSGRTTPQLPQPRSQSQPQQQRMELLEARIERSALPLPATPVMPGSEPAPSRASTSTGTIGTVTGVVRPPVDSDDGESTMPPSTPGGGGSGSGSASSKRKRFTKAEDDLILSGYSMYGSQWEHIADAGQLDRTGEQVRDRHRRLVKVKEKKEKEKEKETESPVKMQEEPMFQPLPQPQVPLQPQVQPQVPLQLQPAFDYEAEIARLKTLLIDIERAHLQAFQDLEERHKHLIERESSVVDALRDCLVRESTYRREDARKQHAKRCDWIGTMTVQREGADFVEKWKPGAGFKKLEEKRSRLQEEMRFIQEGRKRTMEKRRAVRRKEQDSGSGSGTGAGAGTGSDGAGTGGKKWMRGLLGDVGDELYKMTRDKLRKEEDALEEEYRRLLTDKALHIREMVRIRDEEQSGLQDYITLGQNDRYVLLELLGKGGFSEVYMAHDVEQLQPVAVKVHRMSPLWSDEKKASYVKHAIREYGIHKTLRHPNVVECYDVFEIDSLSFATVLQYCSGDDLDLHIKRNVQLPEREARVIVIQIINALVYLASQTNPIIHYDLKPANILFDAYGVVKITDFGLAKVLDEGAADLELTSQGAGTYWYLPPEVFVVGQGVPRISNKVDVWSVGVIFYQMLYGQKPFGQGVPQPQLLREKVILHATEPQFPAGNKPPVSAACRDFIRLCMTYNSEHRPTVEEISTHPYLAAGGGKGKGGGSGSGGGAAPGLGLGLPAPAAGALPSLAALGTMPLPAPVTTSTSMGIQRRIPIPQRTGPPPPSMRPARSHGAP